MKIRQEKAPGVAPTTAEGQTQDQENRVEILPKDRRPCFILPDGRCVRPEDVPLPAWSDEGWPWIIGSEDWVRLATRTWPVAGDCNVVVPAWQVVDSGGDVGLCLASRSDWIAGPDDLLTEEEKHAFALAVAETERFWQSIGVFA
jgi:hypothetical protein